MASGAARLLITPGEPAGVGPDLLLRLAQAPHAAEWIAVADPQLLTERAARLGLPLRILHADLDAAPRPRAAGTLAVLPETLRRPCVPGRPDPANAAYVLATLSRAAALCRAGRADALVTGPVQKSTVAEAGYAFSGHTEFLAEATGAAMPVMMLVRPGLRVALATTHLALREVADAITAERLIAVLEVLHADLRSTFGISEPRILVCGLNPHAGEGGHLGREEIETIGPVIAALRARGMRLEGPLPADTAFTPDALARGDAVLAMYHDQGLPVLKHYGFHQAVNITLGLPILRTSVDHGTALELAGSARADTGSLAAAIELAAALALRPRTAA